MRRFKGDGFTFIELMIVVAIIGILSALAVPKFAQMLEKSREGSTKGNLASMKSATAIYYGDQKGIWPTTLNTASAYSFSLYLDNINPVKATAAFQPGAPSPAGNNVVVVGSGTAPTVAGNGWMYDSGGGVIYVNSTVTDSQSIPYSFYGFQ